MSDARPETAAEQELYESLLLSRLHVRHRLQVMDAAEHRHGDVPLAELVSLARAVPASAVTAEGRPA